MALFFYGCLSSSYFEGEANVLHQLLGCVFMICSTATVWEDAVEQHLYQQLLCNELPDDTQLFVADLVQKKTRNGRNISMCLNILSGFRTLGEPAIAALKSASDHSDDDSREFAVTLISRCKRQSCIPFLVSKIADHNGWVRIAAARGLIQFGSVVIPVVLASYASDPPEIRLYKLVFVIKRLDHNLYSRLIVEWRLSQGLDGPV